MKRFFVLLIATLLVFTACGEKEPAAFLRDADGYGVTDTETGIHYTVLSPAFEPAKASDVRGVYTNEKSSATRTYYEIPLLDPALYLADDERNIWCAAETLPEAKDLTPTAILVCEEQEISVEVMRFSAGTDDAVIAEIRALWFEGEAVSKPEGDMTYTRRVKLASAELPNIYYCFSFVMWGEQAYFYDLFSGRVVAVPQSLAARFPHS